MKKLNRKGFTLIELLAVIVILAIIVVVTVPTILNSINDARLSSLHSLSKEVANWYETSLAQDQLALTGEKILGTLSHTDPGIDYTDGNWYCLKDIKNQDNKSLSELYGLSNSDLVLNDDNSIAPFDDFTNGIYVNCPNDPNKNCSAIKVEKNKAVIFLVARDNGKFNTNGSCNAYALSTGPAAYDYNE